MFLCAHADARFLNESKAHSRAGSHIYLTEDDPFPRFNGAVLSIAQIIICYGICRQIQASRPLRHRKRNDTPPPNPHRDGLASTKKSYPDGLFHSSGSYQYDNCIQTKQDDGHVILVALLPGITRPIPLILGCWLQELG